MPKKKRRNCSTTRLPDALPWMGVKLVMADLPSCSRCILVLRPEDEDISTDGLPGGLGYILYVTDSGSHRTPLLPPPTEGQAQFGMISVPKETDIEQERSSFTLDTILATRWVFAFEWVRGRPALSTLLFTLDHINRPLPLFAILPTYVLPAIFVACMADQPRESIFDVVTAWGPALDEASTLLAPFLRALYEHWIDGPAHAAAVYRQFCEIAPASDTAHRHLLDPFAQVFSPTHLETLRCAERLEPAVIRLLFQVSRYLWDATACVSEQQIRMMEEHAFLRALIPLALWSSDGPLPSERDRVFSSSLEDLYAFWKRWRREHAQTTF
jgi:hypothetical protein